MIATPPQSAYEQMQTEFRVSGIDPHALQLPPHHSLDITGHVLGALGSVQPAHHKTKAWTIDGPRKRSRRAVDDRPPFHRTSSRDSDGVVPGGGSPVTPSTTASSRTMRPFSSCELPSSELKIHNFIRVCDLGVR